MQSEFSAEEGLLFYCDEYGHKRMKYGSYGCWSNLYLNAKVELTYKAGYKWMGFVKDFKLRSHKELARKLNYMYVKKLHENVNKGKFKQFLAFRIKKAMKEL